MPDLGQDVVDLRARRSYLHCGIYEAGRANDLFHRLVGVRALVRAQASPRRRSSAARSARIRRTTTAGCRARTASGSHRDELSLRERSPLYIRRSAGSSRGSRRRTAAHCPVDSRTSTAAVRRAGAPKIARVVLDAVAVADLEDHLQVEARALLETLCFDELVALRSRSSCSTRSARIWSTQASRVSRGVT